MEANLAAFAERAAIEVRYGCRWTGTRRTRRRTGDRFEVETTDGAVPLPGPDRRRRRRRAVHAARRRDGAQPHYADVRPAETYADRRVLIIGKQNSGFELANGLLPWARQLVLVSPSHAKLSVDTQTLVGVRARYVQPYEDHVLGGGVGDPRRSLDRSSEARTGRLHVAPGRTDGGA